MLDNFGPPPAPPSSEGIGQKCIEFLYGNIGRNSTSVHVTVISFFVSNAFLFPQSGATLAVVNPLAGVDHQIAGWFHAHLSQSFVSILHVLSELGSAEWIGIALFLAAIFFVWKRAWPALLTIIVAVPGGMLLNELLKLAVHRHGPFLDGWFVDWSGYSFASGHTIGDFALRAVAFVFAATDEIEALAKIEHSFRGDAGDAGWIQSHCSWRALSQ